MELYNNICKSLPLGKDHMRVSEKQLERIRNFIELIELDGGVDEELFATCVAEHFENLPQSNNGNILAFIEAAPRYFEGLDWYTRE
ncbi:MAG: hypothetical protein H0Z28_11710 [Archaeoglobus sp.]|nr:hypothetical protein [Archaeoglobus sp.]